MTPNKYHSSGRRYTAQELAARAYDLLPRMLHNNEGWSRSTYAPGRNKMKRIKRQLRASQRKALLAATLG